jgi:septal ring factor EnvC (AmiA/AmiB activator)
MGEIEVIEEIKRKIEKIEERIQNHEERISKLERIPSAEKIVEPGLQKFSEFVQLSEEVIKNIFDFDFSESKLTPLKPIGVGTKEKTQSIVLATLLAYKHVFGKTEIPASELRRIVEENRIPADNFARNLNEIIPSLIRRKGEGSKTSYKLTTAGKKEAKEIVRKMAEEQL